MTRATRLPLRQLTSYTADAHAAIAYWERETGGVVPELGWAPLPRGATLLQVQGRRREHQWRAVLDLGQWTATTLPGLASLAPSAGRQERMLALFRASERPLDMPLPALDYDSLSGQLYELAQSHDDELAYLSVNTPQGRLWMQDFPVGPEPGIAEISAATRELPLSLAFCLGYSRVRLGLLASMRAGDVLLLTCTQARVTSVGRMIAGLTINEDGLMTLQDINTHRSDFIDESLVPTGTQADDAGYREILDGSSGQAAMTDIILQVDLVLQRRVMTVGQLDQLFRGQVLQLDPQAERQVELVTNGVCLAKGELVEVNGRLGVEIHHVVARPGVK